MSAEKLDAQHLINDYLRLQKKLDRQPTCIEFAAHHHSIGTLCSVFGSPGWRNLLLAAGGTPRRFEPDLTRAQVVKDYLSLKEELGRTPATSEYAERCHSLAALWRVFGRCGWNNLLKAAGEKPKQTSFVTRDMLIRDYRALKKKLGRQPRRVEYQKECHGIGMIAKKFGKPPWGRLLAAAGDQPIVRRVLSAEHLIQDFLDLQGKMGSRPKIIEYTYQCHTPKVLDRVFGKPGWRGLLAAIGEKAMPRNVLTREHLIQDYLETRAALGREPSQYKFHRRHRHNWATLDRVFGRPGWRNLRKAASEEALASIWSDGGVTPAQIKTALRMEAERNAKHKEARLLDEIRETYRKLSRENLTNNGTLPPDLVWKKATKLRKRLAELFREAGKVLTAEEAFQTSGAEGFLGTFLRR